ncbi:pre-mRNA-processing protein 40A isoform X1 [Iris pallida]|uniref:Pre-mRNA-processing protein 40A isoform X1 n=1 Tax=Iris pallida TaxID=29817 RepID=A0AAX6H9L6_IRIPA|nr:pre-mRNA-processing protein 40A isoform X1 [Iris pallida]
MLYSVKELSASSTWEECKSLFEDCQYSWISGEEFMRETFEKYVAHLQEKLIEKERKRDEGKGLLFFNWTADHHFKKEPEYIWSESDS